MPDPTQFPSKIDWLAEIRKNRNWTENKGDAEYQESYSRQMGDIWEKAHARQRQSAGDETSGEFPKSAVEADVEQAPPGPVTTIPGKTTLERKPEEPKPKGMFGITPPDPREAGPGSRELERAVYEGGPWPKGTEPQGGIFTRDVETPITQYGLKPMAFGTELGIAGMFGAAKGGIGMMTGEPGETPLSGAAREIRETWNNPGDAPNYQLLAGMVPILGAGTLPQFALDIYFAGEKAIWNAARLAEQGAYEGSRWAGPMARFAGREARAAGLGLLAGAPSSISQGTPGPSLQMAGSAMFGQTATEGASYLFGGARKGRAEATVSGMINEIKDTLPKEVSDELNVEKDIVKVFHPREELPDGTPITMAEKATAADLNRTEAQLSRELRGNPFRFTLDPDFAHELEKKKIGVPGIEVPEVTAQPERPATRDRRVRNPLYRPEAKALMKKLGIPAWTIERGQKYRAAVPGVPEHTYVADAQEVFKFIKEVEDLGWDINGNARYDKNGAGAFMRSHAKKLSAAFSTFIADKTGRVSDWPTAKFRDMNARMLSHFFQEKGMIVNGRLQMSRVQELATHIAQGGYYMDFIENMGSKRGRELVNQIMRGADPTAQKDIEGRLRLYHRISFWNPMSWFRTGYESTPYFSGRKPVDSWRSMMYIGLKIGASQLLTAFMNEMDQEAQMAQSNPQAFVNK